MWIQIKALIRAELKLFFSDSRAVILYIAVPAFLASFIGSMTGGGLAKGSGGVSVWIADLDGSAMSEDVVARFASDSAFRITVTNEAAVRAQVLAGRVPVGLVLPERFGLDAPRGLFDTNRRPRIGVLYDPSRQIERQMVEGMLAPKVVQSVVQNTISWGGASRFLSERLGELERATGMAQDERLLYRRMLEPVREWVDGRARSSETNAASGRRDLRLPMPFDIAAEGLTAKAEAQYNGYAHSFAGIGLQFVLMSMVDLAIGLLRERESGWFRRLRASPLTRRSLLAAKAGAYGLVSMMSLGGCMGFAMLAFGVRVQGSWFGFVLCLLMASAMSAALGLMLAAIGRTQGGTRGISIAVILVLVMLGGAWMPTFIFPGWLQTVSLFTPTRWAIDAFDAMTWRGLELESLAMPFTAMSAWTCVFAGVALWRFRWDEGR